MADVKKKLKFLNKKERTKLVSSIRNEKLHFTDSFKEDFSSKYKEYVKHFPTRKILFDITITFHMFNVLIGLLLEKVLEMFVEFEKRTDKYAQLQLAWYLFTGKVLNIDTGTNIDVTTRAIMNEMQLRCNSASEVDKRIFFSCVMKALLDFFLQYAINTKSKRINGIKQSKIHVDETSIYRISGALLHSMVKKRKSARLNKRLSTAKKILFTSELSILNNMCLSKPEKETMKDTLPIGFISYDRGNLLVMRPVILNITRLLIKEISSNISSSAYSKFGSRMMKIARIKLTNNKGLKDMFCACVQSIPQCESQDNTAVTSIYKEFSEKLFNTIANEFVKRDKFLNNRTAQLMLRDKLKFYASSKQDNKKKNLK